MSGKNLLLELLELCCSRDVVAIQQSNCWAQGLHSNVKSSSPTKQCDESVDLSPHFWTCIHPL